MAAPSCPYIAVGSLLSISGRAIAGCEGGHSFVAVTRVQQFSFSHTRHPWVGRELTTPPIQPQSL
jgi:hypothetical protein